MLLSKPNSDVDMLAVDTNVVVRYLTGDHPRQALTVRKLIDTNDILFPCTVMLETEWVLRRMYGYPRGRIHAGLVSFIGLPNVESDDVERAAQALDWFKQGMDFAGALHLAACDGDISFATFDRKLVAAARKVAVGKVRAL